MAISNGHGVDANREDDMAALAKLPRALRDLLNDAPEAFSAQEMHMMKRRHRLDDNELLEHVRDLIHGYQTRRTLETYGVTHPQLNIGENSYDKWPCKRRSIPNTRLRYLRHR